MDVAGERSIGCPLQEEEKEVTESAQVQLLKLQLDEARCKVNEAKKS